MGTLFCTGDRYIIDEKPPQRVNGHADKRNMLKENGQIWRRY
jgi:hypothetical protein